MQKSAFERSRTFELRFLIVIWTGTCLKCLVSDLLCTSSNVTVTYSQKVGNLRTYSFSTVKNPSLVGAESESSL